MFANGYLYQEFRNDCFDSVGPSGFSPMGSLLDIQEKRLGTKVKLNVGDEIKRKYKTKNDIFSRLIFPT